MFCYVCMYICCHTSARPPVHNHTQQEVVRFGVSVQVVAIEALPPKYTCFRVLLQRGMKRVSSADLFADAAHRIQSDKDSAATLHFVSSMQRAESGLDFEDKTYKLLLLRVNSKSATSKLKTVGSSTLNIAEACTRNGLQLRLQLEPVNHDAPTSVELVIHASTRMRDGDSDSASLRFVE